MDKRKMESPETQGRPAVTKAATSYAIYRNEVKSIPKKAAEEMLELHKAAAKGDKEAAKEVVKQFLEVVISTAEKHRNANADIMDAIQAGNMALMKAAANYDPERDASFKTYAYKYITNAINKANRENADPLHATAKNKNAKFYTAISMDEETPDEQPLSEIIKDDKAEDPQEVTEEISLIETITKAMQELTECEREVITRRYGLNGRQETLSQIGERMGYSKQRISQIEVTALRKMRTGKNAQKLREFL